MAWQCITKIKNAFNEFKFATFPLDGYNGPTGSSDTEFSYYPYRESYSVVGSANFNKVMAILNDLNSQSDIPELNPPASYAKMVFGNVGGSAVYLQYLISGSLPSYGVDIAPYVYRNMVGRRMLTSSSGWNTDSLYDKKVFTWALVYNDETSEIYLVQINGWLKWYRAVGSYDYYDRAVLTIRIIDGTGADNNLYSIFSESIPSGGGSNPYDDGGTSTTGGGENATYDDTSDAINLPSAPLLNLTLNGFLTAYAPTLQQIRDLASFVWSDWLTGHMLNKIFANVADAIISLHMLPFSPSANSTLSHVMVGNYDSGVEMYQLNLQFNDVSCGSLKIPLYWDNYLDYNPYTKLTLFLPYVGEVTLNPDEVMDHTLSILYRVDALTGAFVCFISREDDKIIGQYQGNCALSVPLSSANYEQLHAAMLTIATAAVGAAATTGGLLGGFAAGGEAGMQAALGVMDTKVKHNVSGALGSAAGFMGSQKPYLIIERARQCLPQDLGTFVGYPSQITETLGALSGFTQVAEIILDDIPLTDQEKEQLRGILEGGVIL